MRVLLDAFPGIDVNHRDSGIGWTALHTAAFGGVTHSVALLLSLGADPSIENVDDKTAEDLAREEGEDAIADMIAEVLIVATVPVQWETPSRECIS